MRWKPIWIVAVIGIGLVGPRAPLAEDAAAEKGQLLYLQSCATCHGENAKGVQGLGKDLTTSEFAKKKTDAELVEFIKVGRAADDPLNTTGILMPPKAGNPALTDDDMKAIVKYLRVLEGKS